mmetsp:Transcript_45224/g.114498  ORF Transcript_45224/g.114498 Transcript_45224/m.114498 type:complete len:200 (-) Transcript_45224:167-766(-)
MQPPNSDGPRHHGPLSGHRVRHAVVGGDREQPAAGGRGGARGGGRGRAGRDRLLHPQGPAPSGPRRGAAHPHAVELRAVLHHRLQAAHVPPEQPALLRRHRVRPQLQRPRRGRRRGRPHRAGDGRQEGADARQPRCHRVRQDHPPGLRRHLLPRKGGAGANSRDVHRQGAQHHRRQGGGAVQERHERRERRRALGQGPL